MKINDLLEQHKFSTLFSSINQNKWTFLGGTISFFLPLFVYWRGLVPGLAIEGDSGEIITALSEWSVIHSPGFPGYMVAAKLFTFLTPFFDFSYRVNLFSAFSAALCSYWIFRIGKVMNRPEAGLGAALIFSFSSEFWYSAISAEVYSFAILNLLWLLELLLRFDSKNRMQNLFFGFTLGFAVSSHVYTWALTPILLIFIFNKAKRDKEILQVLKNGLIGFGLGLFPYLYIILRAGEGLYINEGGINSIDRFFEHISWIIQRERVETPTELSLNAWLEIKGLQLFHFVNEFFIQWGKIGSSIMLICFLLAIWLLKYRNNLFSSKQRPSLYAWMISGCFMALVVWIIFTGDQKSPGVLSEMAVHMITLYLFVSLSILIISQVFRSQLHYLSFLMPLILFTLIFRYSEMDLNDNQIAVHHASDLLTHLPKDSILFGDDDNDLMTTTYLMSVKGFRRDIALLNLMNGTAWNYDNYKKLYHKLHWPIYSPTYYKGVFLNHIKTHNIFCSSWYGANAFLKTMGLERQFIVIPVFGAYQLLPREKLMIQSKLEDIKNELRISFQIESTPTQFHLRAREIDVIATRAEYFMHQAHLLFENGQLESGQSALKKIFTVPQVGNGEYGRAIIQEAQRLSSKYLK